MSDARLLERAFDMARSGSVTSIEDVRRGLKIEGFEGVEQHIAGRTLSAQLRTIITAARRERGHG